MGAVHPSGRQPVGGDLGDDVGDIGLWLDAVHLGRLDHRIDRGGTRAAGLGAGEQPVLAADGDGADRALGNIVVDLEPTVAEEAGERLPSPGAITNGLGRRRLGRQLPERVVERGAKRRHQRPRPLLADASSDVGGLAAYLGFDRVELADPVEQIGGERCGLLLVALEQLAPKMRPVSDLGDPPIGVVRVEPGISVGLEKAGESGELALRVDAGAVGAERIPGKRRRGCG